MFHGQSGWVIKVPDGLGLLLLPPSSYKEEASNEGHAGACTKQRQFAGSSQSFLSQIKLFLSIHNSVSQTQS